MSTAACVIADVHVGYIEGLKPAYRVASVLDNICHMLVRVQATNTPVLYIRHEGDPGETLAVDSPFWAIHPAITPLPYELIGHKRSVDTFYLTSLSEELTI